MMIKREMMMSKKLIGYIRVSTEGQAETGLGLEGQRAKIESYCQTYDLDLIDIIIDDGWSAKDLNRQGMQQVIERLEDEDVNGIVIATLDRLTRSMRDLHHLLATIFQSNELHCVSEKVDTSSAAGRLCLNLLMSVAEWERDVISERTRTALAAKKRLNNGESINGRAPYGQKWEDGALIPCPTEQPILETMKHLRDLGQSYQQIADRLTAMGPITRRGGVWRVSTVYTILKKASA